jgi:small GTP-binding protein
MMAPSSASSPYRDGAGNHPAYKCIIVGNTGVGKSSLMKQFTERVFLSTHRSTIGMDFQARHVLLGDHGSAKLQVWDSSGHEKFRTITSAYYRGCQGVMVVFSVDDAESFLDLDSWLREIRRFADPDVSLLLVGNKTDLSPGLRRVPRADAEAFAKKFNLDYAEASAYESAQVDAAFERLAQAADARRRASCRSLRLAVSPGDPRADTVDLSLPSRGKCCVIL